MLNFATFQSKHFVLGVNNLCRKFLNFLYWSSRFKVSSSKLLGHGLGDRGVVVRFLAGESNSCLQKCSDPLEVWEDVEWIN